MNVDPKTLFYHRKNLVKNGLIMKQVHHQKSRGQNFQGTLFHLPRLLRSKSLNKIHFVVEIVRNFMIINKIFIIFKIILKLGPAISQI